MALKLVVLGSGTAVPCLRRAPSGYLLVHNDETYLIDCGSGTLRRILKAGYDPVKLTGIFITHLHPDHISDLSAIIHAMVLSTGRPKELPLHIICHSRIKDYFQNCITSLMKPPPFEVVFHIPQGTAKINQLEIHSLPTGHTPESLGYRITVEGKVIVLTGDASYSDALVEFCKGADLLVADSSYTEKTKRGHMSALECGHLAEKAGVKVLLLSHLYPVAPDEEFEREAKEAFKGMVLVARDLMFVEP